MNKLYISIVIALWLSAPAQAEEITLPHDSPLHSLVNELWPTGTTTDTGYWERKHSTQIVRLGWEQFKKHRNKDALKSFMLAVAMNDKDPSAYFGIAYVCSVQNQLSDAIYFYRKALKYEQNFAPIYANLAKALLLSGNKSEEPKQLLEKAVQIDPNDGESWLTYAGCLAERGDWDGAKDKANRAKGLGKKVQPAFEAELQKHN